MTERRETGRSPENSNEDDRPRSKSRAGWAKSKPKPPRPKSKAKPKSRTSGAVSDGLTEIAGAKDGERIAKYLARCGVASRRACETLIEEGKVSVNGQVLRTPAFKVSGREDIRVRRRPVNPPEETRLWLYHKPAGLITTNNDPDGRRTIFQELPKDLPRVVTVGRLDLNTEGLMLLTNDGEFARSLELPGNEFVRIYRARAHGRTSEGKFERLRKGIRVDGETFGRIDVELEIETGTNNWLLVSLKEGKKREVRRALEAVDLQVNRLIRVAYGPFELSDLKPGAVAEIDQAALYDELGQYLPEKAQRSARRESDSRRAGERPNRGNNRSSRGGRQNNRRR